MELSNTLKKLPTQFFASLVQKVNAAIAEGRDVINLGQGNPDRPTPPHIVKALQEAATDPATHKYSLFRGMPELKQAVSDFYKREYHVDIDPNDEVAILGGAKVGLVELPICVLNPGDYMLLPDPGYPDYLSGPVLANVHFDTMPLLEENDFLPDYDALSPEVKKRAKLMYLNYPNNPTGATADLAFFEKTVQFAKEHGIYVVHDFAYGALGFDGEKPVSFLQAEGAKEIGVEFYTLSKTYNMAGWRVAFAVGNRDIIEAINLLQDHLFCSLFPAVQRAAAYALNSDQSCVEELRRVYEYRRNVLVEEARRIGWNVKAPKGSFFAWLPVPEGFTSQEFSDYLLDKADVAVASGNGFGEHGEGYIRVGLLVEEDRLREAIRRIEALGIFQKDKAKVQK
ncbi:pyridoxal phosphate-dependent aminotransferase [Ureibacillus thermophilus]|uniref:Pyridoxal phosphate-dependent aminotransferase n=1 Tax=Ureibacillus thermophilus TaxID=367743 RepID=A0A4P6UQA5_9BACL|nr:pyridoxal phosphate-dependent aminotransferase [Ureibacillus thermophilus]QBK25144.1 pyridoxal phosphate-dependent aminotransferase [Ureibacillus thermophilus]